MTDESDLVQRIQALEARVAEQQTQIRELQALLFDPQAFQQAVHPRETASTSVPPAVLPESVKAAVTQPQTIRSVAPGPQKVAMPPPPAPSPTDWLNSWEFWLNRFGIGMLLLGVAFLFKYALDQGWLTAYLLVGIGYLIGGALGVLGWRLRTTRLTFSHILWGGCVGVLYITTFAGFQVFEIFPYGLAYGLMVLITLGAFLLSLQQRQAVFSVIGATGGLATPFLLYQDSGSVVGLVIYTLLILVGCLGIYGRQGWRSLYGTSFILGSLVLGVATVAIIGKNVDATSWDQPVVQFGLVILFAGYGLFPLNSRHRLGPAIEIVTVLNPFVFLALTAGLWQFLVELAGWLALALAVLYGAGSYWKRTDLAWRGVFGLTAALLALSAILLHLNNREVIFIPLTGEAILLHWLGRRYKSLSLTALGHIFWAVLGACLLGRLIFFEPSPPVAINQSSLIDLAMLAGLGFTAWALPNKSLRWLYATIAYIGILIWTQREFVEIGSGLVTLLWGLYGVGMLVVGLRRDQANLRVIALLTLIASIVKLFFVDLIGVEAIWRVLLFMGFGIIFLVLSYYFRSLWQPKNSGTARPLESNTSNSSEDIMPNEERE